MKASLVLRFRDIMADGGLIEMVVWRLAQELPPSRHCFKYRLVYVVDGERIIGFDNERGKDAHKHVGVRESRYRFVDVDRLIDDFQAEVERWKSAH